MNKTEKFWQMASLQDIPIAYREILEANGFEDWDTFEELTVTLLKKLDITKEKHINTMLKLKNEIMENQIDKKTSLNFLDDVTEKSDFEIEIKKNLKSISNKMVFKNCFERKIKNEKIKKFCKRISNLDLSSQKIKILKFNLPTNYLKYLKVLDLSNNKICQIENLLSFINLQFLDLSNNLISEIQGLEKNKKLRTLSLNNNYIKVINNLQNLVNLEDLSINNQNLENEIDKEFILDSFSFENLKKLKYLELNNNKILDFFPLSYLLSLKKLEINNTNLESSDQLSCFLPYLTELKKLKYFDNPICKKKKHYEMIVVQSNENLEEANGKNIFNIQRTFLKQMSLKKKN